MGTADFDESVQKNKHFCFSKLMATKLHEGLE